MFKLLLGTGLVSAMAFTTPTFAQSADALAVIRVIESIGCSLGPDTEAEFDEALDLSRAAMQAAANELFNAGLLQLVDERLVYTGGACAAQAPVLEPAPATLVATMIALRDTGCAVSEAAADDVLMQLGPRDVIMGHLRDLDAVNLARISDDYGGVLAADRMCSATDEVIATFAAQVPSMLGLEVRDRLPFAVSRRGARALFVEWMVSEGCRTPSFGAMWGMVEIGLDEAAASVVEPLLEGGILERDGDDLRVSAALCAATLADRAAAVAALPPGDVASE